MRAWQPLSPAHAKLLDLTGELLDNGHWRLLWMPPTLPYWPLQGLFAGQEAATKTLVFSAWNLVPDVISGWLSYEAERRMTAGPADQRHIRHYDEPGRQQRPLLRLADREGVGRSRHRLLLLLLPCLALADDAHPLDAPPDMDRRAWVRAQIDRLLAAPNLPDPHEGPVDARWEWALPMLLDPGLRGLLVRWRDGGIATCDGAAPTPPNPEAFGGYVEDLLHLEPDTLGRRPAALAELATEIALGAPGVLAARMLKPADLGDEDRRALAVVLADALWRLFNRPAVIALLAQGGNAEDTDAHGEGAYWHRVLGYCIDGNLQAVLDETWHLLREQHAWSDDADATTIAARCVEQLAAVIEPSVSRVHAKFLRPESSGRIERDELRLRTDFALRFGDARGAAVGEERQLNQDTLRAAFNSPFRPFVLASTSVGQEGLDFHPWCHRVVHWNLPGNPVDLEQREGRINRYKGHAIRRNVAAAFAGDAFARWRPGDDLWSLVFLLAERAARAADEHDMVPCWIAHGPCRVQRRVPMLPYTREVEAFGRLKRQLAAYRIVFGQPRQEELLTLLDRSGIAGEQLRAWAVDLSPPCASRDQER
jgi:hypothetical protein